MKRPSKDRWIFNQRVKEMNRPELENELYKTRDWISILILIIFVVGLLALLAFIGVSEMQNDFNKIITPLANIACQETFNEKFTVLGSNPYLPEAIIFCENNFLALEGQ